MPVQKCKDPKKLTEEEKFHCSKIEPVGKLKVGEEGEVKVTVGHEPHPMDPNHHIEWIELWVSSKPMDRVIVLPDQEVPEATFTVTLEKGDVFLQALAHCNQHGTWEHTIEV